MQEVLQNTANYLLTTYCVNNNIDCSDTHIAKNGRGYKYSLVDNQTGRTRITIIFSKHSALLYHRSIEHVTTH